MCNVIEKHVMKFNDLAEVRCSRHYVTSSWSQSLYQMLSLFSNTVILQLCFFLFLCLHQTCLLVRPTVI